MNAVRRIWFLTAARSEYDLLAPVIRAVSQTAGLEAKVIVAGAHLSPFHGMGVDQIRADGVSVAGTVESLLSSESWEGRALSFAQLIEGLTRLISRDRPDILFIAGDREEALAGALTANFLGIHVAHSHGGDRAVALDLDEVLRPAISKLSHFHFTATESHRQRLIRMGEDSNRVWAVGGAGLDSLRDEPDVPEDNLAKEFGIDVRRPFFMLIFHSTPMLNSQANGREMAEILNGVLSVGHPVLCSYPNFDPGNIAVRKAIDEVKSIHPGLFVYHNLPRRHFVSLYRRCSAMIGNSSSVVLESGFMKVPGILVGPRQDLREVGPNVLRVNATAREVREACIRAVEDAAFNALVRQCPSIYGDGRSSGRIAEILSKIKLDRDILLKVMAY